MDFKGNDQPESAPTPGEALPEPAKPSWHNLQQILRRVPYCGHLLPTKHFKERCEGRGFSMVDVEEILETGDLAEEVEFDGEYFAWKLAIIGIADGKKWKLVCSISCLKDFVNDPTVTLITVHRFDKRHQKKRRIEHIGKENNDPSTSHGDLPELPPPDEFG